MEYPTEVSGDFVAMAEEWKNIQDQPALTSWYDLLENTRRSLDTGGASTEQLVKIESEIINDLSKLLLKEIKYNNDFYNLADLISRKEANCLGYAQMLYFLGKSLKLSVDAINILELHDGAVAYREGRGYHHAACIFNLSDGTSMMVDPAYGLGDSIGVGRKFVKDRDFKEEGNYLILKDTDSAPVIHRKIQVLDIRGIIALRWFQQGVYYGKKANYDSARICYINALQLNPEIAEVHNNLGLILGEAGQFDSSRACFQHCIALNPGHANAYYNLGNEYGRTNETGRAIEFYSKAIELDSLHAKAYNAMGEVYHYKLDSADSARACYRSAVEADPGYSRTWFNLGVLYDIICTRTGIADTAIAYYSNAILLDRDHASAFYHRGLNYLALGKKQEAKADLTIAVALDSSFIDSLDE